MRKRAVWLESLISIWNCIKDPRQHILEKQRLICVDGDPFDFSGFHAMVAETRFLAATVFFLLFLALLLTVFKFFFTIWQLFYFENKPLRCTKAVWQIQQRPKTAWWSAATS
jgi:hypothetical protein